MADVVHDDLEVGSDEVLVEKKIVPAHRRRFSLLALLIVAAFVVTCGVVFFGGNLGPYSAPVAQAPTGPTPTQTP
jgi:hypothetical protein